VLHKEQVLRGAGKACIDDIREQSMKQKLFLGGKRTVNVALRLNLELEMVMKASDLPSGSGNHMTGHCGEAPPPTKIKDY
jgi:hypothetical protein